MKNFLQYICIMITYTIIDVIYQIFFGLKMMDKIYTNAGIRDVITAEPKHPWTILLFFLMIALVLHILVVKPALDKKSVKSAIFGGMLVGLAAYGTYTLVFLWSLVGYPWAGVFAGLFEGLLFCSISAGFTTWLFLRKKQR